MKRILLLLLFSVLVLGCKKDEDFLHEVRFYNGSTKSSYRVSLYDSSDRLVRQAVLGFTEAITFGSLPAGEYRWHVLQLNGYLLYPTEQGSRFTLNSSYKSKYIEFP